MGGSRDPLRIKQYCCNTERELAAKLVLAEGAMNMMGRYSWEAS